MKYYIICGEASGDLHASNLVKGIIEEDSEAVIRFWGGDATARACGDRGTMVRHYKDSAVMGFVEVIKKLGTITGNLSFCKKDILSWHPDVVILIDYPGFNLKIAKFAHTNGYKVYYYIPPKLWARGENRIKLIRKYVDDLFIIFPFEIEYFNKLGVKPKYFGNPLVDSINQYEYHQIGDSCKRKIALLAGSRAMEIKFLMPRFVQLERLMKLDPKWSDFQLFVAVAPSMDIETYRHYLPEDSKIQLVSGDTYSVLKSAEAAVISSGTASLEAALIKTPQVVCYGVNQITYLLARLVLKIRYISLANLILDKLIFKELIQHDSTPEKILEELENIVFNTSYIDNMLADYDCVEVALGGAGASRRIAAEMVGELREDGV